MAIIYKVEKIHHDTNIVYSEASTFIYSVLYNDKDVMFTKIRLICDNKDAKQRICMLHFVAWRDVTENELLCFLAYILSHINNIRKSNSDNHIFIRKCKTLIYLLDKFNKTQEIIFNYSIAKNLIINNDILINILQKKLSGHCTLLLLTKVNYFPALD